MKARLIIAILLASIIAAPALAGQAPKGHHPMTKHATSPKAKLRSLGHGVYVDSKGAYRSKDGKFMSKATAEKLLGKTGKKGPARDAKGRFVKSKQPAKPTPSKKPGLMSKIKSKLTKKR